MPFGSDSDTTENFLRDMLHIQALLAGGTSRRANALWLTDNEAIVVDLESDDQDLPDDQEDDQAACPAPSQVRTVNPGTGSTPQVNNSEMSPCFGDPTQSRRVEAVLVPDVQPTVVDLVSDDEQVLQNNSATTREPSLPQPCSVLPFPRPQLNTIRMQTDNHERGPESHTEQGQSVYRSLSPTESAPHHANTMEMSPCFDRRTPSRRTEAILVPDVQPTVVDLISDDEQDSSAIQEPPQFALSLPQPCPAMPLTRPGRKTVETQTGSLTQRREEAASARRKALRRLRAEQRRRAERRLARRLVVAAVNRDHGKSCHRVLAGSGYLTQVIDSSCH